jgi:hypothetical protein
VLARRGGGCGGPRKSQVKEIPQTCNTLWLEEEGRGRASLSIRLSHGRTEDSLVCGCIAPDIFLSKTTNTLYKLRGAYDASISPQMRSTRQRYTRPPAPKPSSSS